MVRLCIAVVTLLVSVAHFVFAEEGESSNIGIDIQNVEPERTFSKEELLIENIERKTEGELAPAREPTEEITLSVREEQEVEGEGKGSLRRGSTARIPEREVILELRKRNVKRVIKSFNNQQVFREIQRLMQGQRVATSEARKWLEDKGEKGEREGKPPSRGTYEFSPLTDTRPLEIPADEYEEGKRKRNSETTSQSEKKGKALFGYCVVDRDITVGAVEMKARFPCVFSDSVIDTGFVWGTLKPEPRAYSLLFVPERIETEKGAYRVMEGLSLNGNRSSNNIATTVNTRMIEKVLAKAGVDTAKDSKKMVEEAWKNDGTTVFTTGTVTIEKKEFNLNLLPYYAIWTAGLSIAESLLDIFQKETRNIPVLFTVHRGARLYVEVVIDEEPYIR